MLVEELHILALCVYVYVLVEELHILALCVYVYVLVEELHILALSGVHVLIQVPFTIFSEANTSSLLCLELC